MKILHVISGQASGFVTSMTLESAIRRAHRDGPVGERVNEAAGAKNAARSSKPFIVLGSSWAQQKKNLAPPFGGGHKKERAAEENPTSSGP